MHCTLFWNQANNKLMTPLGKDDNAPAFRMAPGFTKFNAFCAKCSADPALDLTETVQADDVDQEDVNNKIMCQQAVDAATSCKHKTCGCTTKPESEDSEGADDPVAWCALMGNMFKLNGKLSEGAKEHIECDQEDPRPANLEAELLTHHHKFGHTLFQ